MNNWRSKLIAVFLLPWCMLPASPALLTFDLQGWLTAIDELYSSYDLVMNTIKQVEQGYQQYQHLLEEAKSWDFDAEWDGDIDIRDDIRRAGRSINRQLSNIREMEELFTTKQLVIGGHAYTVQDLLFNGDPDKDLVDCIKNIGNDVQSSWDKAVDAIEGELTQEERVAIMRKYGVSAKNFIYVQKKKQAVNQAFNTIFAQAQADEETKTQMNIAELKTTTALLESITNPNADHTEKELLQKMSLLNGELIYQIQALKNATFDAVNAVCSQHMAEREEQEQTQKNEVAIKRALMRKTKQDPDFKPSSSRALQ